MKIRIEVSCLATYSLSGVNFYTKRLTEALDATKDVDLAASYFNFLDRQPIPIVNLKHPLDKNSLIPLRVFAKLHSYGIALPFDLFKPSVDLTIHPNFSLWSSVKTKVNTAVIHDLTYIHFPEAVQEKNLAHLRRVVPRALKKADFIITVSEAVKSELIKEFSLDPARCLVTPVPPEPIYAVVSANELHEKYGIPTEKFIFFIGNLEPRKNLPTLIEAYRRLPSYIKKKYSLILGGGKGWKTEKSQAAIDEAQAAGEQIVHVGYIDQQDSPAFFQKASLFIMPSIYEGFGMPVLEAMAARTPVIASDIPVHREAGGDGVLYADPTQAEEFRDRIIEILTSKSTTDALLAKSAIQLETFSWAKNAKRIVDHANRYLETR